MYMTKYLQLNVKLLQEHVHDCIQPTNYCNVNSTGADVFVTVVIFTNRDVTFTVLVRGVKFDV